MNGKLRTLELLHHVPRDGLALAIGVGGEQDGASLFGGHLELGEHLGLVLDDLVGFLEVLLDIDPHLLGEVFDVPLRGQHLIAGAEVLLDGLRLRRRLDHHECLQNCGHVENLRTSLAWRERLRIKN